MQKSELVSKLKNLINEGTTILENSPSKTYLAKQVKQVRENYRRGDPSGFWRPLFGGRLASTASLKFIRDGQQSQMSQDIERLQNNFDVRMRQIDSKYEQWYSGALEALKLVDPKTLTFQLMNTKGLSKTDAKFRKGIVVLEKALHLLEKQMSAYQPTLIKNDAFALLNATTFQLFGTDGQISAVELLKVVSNPKNKSIRLASSGLQEINFAKEDGAFEKDVASFFHARGFEVAHTQDAPIDFIAIGKGTNGPIFLIGECQTNYSTREHLDKLYTVAKKIQGFLNEKGVNGVLEPVYITNFDAGLMPRDLRELLAGRGGILLDKNLLSKLTKCSSPQEAYQFIIDNRYTLLAVR